MATRNVGESVLARLRNVSRERRIDMMALVTRYALERLLYRISVSPHAGEFCLKGGMLMAAYNDGDLLRPTSDLDLNGFSHDGGIEKIEVIVREVAAMKIDDDGVSFDLSSLTVAKAREGLIPGGKVNLVAFIHTARPRVQIDVGFGNVITPEAQQREIPTLLSGVVPRPVISTYPLETVIAEKVHAMAQFGIMNTRHKDYYDIHRIMRSHVLDGDFLASAIRRTFEHQQRVLTADPEALSVRFAEESTQPWAAFLKKAGAKDMPSYPEVMEELRTLLLPVIAAARGEASSPGTWDPESGWIAPAPAPAP